ncbi:MAG: radical family uncharacterized protein [Anaerosporomusa subterranea]|jgi:radical SAM family uncharacterized protein|nr:radical family uncharacterized protein [Anaerosporomusa subterranea]
MSWNLIKYQQSILAAEQGASVYAPGARQPFALAYPNSYHVGMSNLGMQIIYQQINLRGDTACERFFFPDPEQLREHIRTNTPLLSIETQRPLREFPLIGFAVSFEMDYFHLLDMLALGRVPLRASERTDNDPLVIIGGPCATFNPEPLAEFVDICVVGEGEEVIHELLDVYYREQERRASRQEILLALAQVPGLYIPALYQHEYNEHGIINGSTTLASVPKQIVRRWVENLDSYPGETVIVTPNTEFSNMYLVEVARGCGRHCRFCMAGYCFRRPRSRSLETVKKGVDAAVAYQARVGLMGAAISDYPDINALCTYIADKGLSMSVASLRADSLTEILVSALANSGHKTITLAPEAGSERLRRVINKTISDQSLEIAVKLAIQAGIVHVRLYIMVGLPTETDDDITAIAVMAKTIKRQMEVFGSKGKLTLSVNPFVPKPFTPFQWLPMCDYAIVSARLASIQASLKGIRGIEVLVESPKEAYIQAVLARGDRRLSRVLALAHSLGGRKYWKQAIKQEGLNENEYLYRERSHEEVLPWHRYNIGLETDYLRHEHQAALQEKYTAPCFDDCHRCGVCR